MDDYIREDNPVRSVDAFIDELDLAGIGFDGVHAEETVLRQGGVAGAR